MYKRSQFVKLVLLRLLSEVIIHPLIYISFKFGQSIHDIAYKFTMSVCEISSFLKFSNPI